MSVLVYDCGSVANTITATLDTSTGAMIIRGTGDIDNYANEYSPWYSDRESITQVTVDKGITRIGSGIFYNCTNLEYISIPKTVTTIGSDVFNGCTSLESIKIPKSVTAIGNGAFADSGLTEIKFFGNPPEVGTDILDNVTATGYVPEGNTEWDSLAKAEVAGNGSTITWSEFDIKPNLIEYDELDYLWSKIKKYVDSNVSVTQVVSSGTKIATITINGVATDLYSSPFSGTIGDSTTPIYIDNGVPTACGGSLAVDITGNAATATDSTTVKELNGTSNYNRPILLSGLTNITTTTDNQTTPVYSNNFYANPSTGVFTSVSGFSSTGSYTTSLTTSTHLAGNKGTALINSTAAKGYTMLARMKSTNGVFTHGVYNADYQFYYTADSLISAGTNNVTKVCLTINENGTVKAPNGFIGSVTGDVTGNCSGSSGSCTGNAATATSATSATTATNANNAKLTHTVGNTEYPLVFATSAATNDGNQALRIGCPTTTLANCALRCKAYCAAANTQGESTLIIGNNLATASANNSRGRLILYGTSTGYTVLAPGYNSTSNITVTLPSSTGTLALTSSNITGSSASCTGNAATATTASACSGNAASATYATNIRVTDTDSNTWYPLVFSSGSAANTNYAARVDADSILVDPGVSPAANTQGNCFLQLGNAKAKNTAGNKRGVLRIYGTGTSYTEITSAVGATARSISFPDKAGTVALTSDIPAVANCFKAYTSWTSVNCRIVEMTFSDDVKIKYIIPASTSQDAASTITFKQPFTSYCSTFESCRDGKTTSGNQFIFICSSLSDRYGGGPYGYSDCRWNTVGTSISDHVTLTAYTFWKKDILFVMMIGY